MKTQLLDSVRSHLLLICLATLTACGKQESAPAPSTAPAGVSGQTAAAPDVSGAPTATPTAAAPTDASWTPEVLEELLAPIAIYPDVVLGHVLSASTNPQEVLDAGNWLIAHQDLTGAARDEAAEKLGFSPSVRALLQFPETVDMMCMKLDWTTQLGQAFTADQAAVLDAVQRLRQQAKEVGNLESSPQMAVATETQEDKEIVTVKPADPEVVYVPKYDPVAVYAPPPATIPPPTTVPVTTTPVTTTTTTTTTTEDKGHSTGALITTGLLAFGAGILVNEVFDDDDDWDDYYPNYAHGGMYYGPRPYYPPPPYMYRPPYGAGFYPSHGYTRPPNYQHGFNNNTIIVNNGGNNYWNRFNPGQQPVYAKRAQSPITTARPNRPELSTLNNQAAERARTAASRQQNLGGATQVDRKGQTGYAGARPENREARERMVQDSARPTDRATARPTDRSAANVGGQVAADLPKRPQGTYAGASKRPTQAAKPATKAAPRETPRPKPNVNADRGRPEHSPTVANRPNLSSPTERPSIPPNSRPATDRAGGNDRAAASRDRPSFEGGGGGRSGAFEGASRSGSAERAASNRGHKSAGARQHR